MKKIFSLLLLTLLSFNVFAQKKEGEKAISKGKQSNGYYYAEVDEDELLTTNKLNRYLSKKSYSTSEIKTKKIFKYGEYHEVIVGFYFLPELEYKEKLEEDNEKERIAKLDKELKQMFYRHRKGYSDVTFSDIEKFIEQNKTELENTYYSEVVNHNGFFISEHFIKLYPNRKSGILNSVTNKIREIVEYNNKNQYKDLEKQIRSFYYNYPSFQNEVKTVLNSSFKDNISMPYAAAKALKEFYNINITSDRFKFTDFYQLTDYVADHPNEKDKFDDAAFRLLSPMPNYGKENVLQQYLKFIKVFPTSSYANNVRYEIASYVENKETYDKLKKIYNDSKLDELVEENLYKKVDNTYSLSAEHYLQVFPNGKYVEQVKASLSKALAYEENQNRLTKQYKEQVKLKCPESYTWESKSSYYVITFYNSYGNKLFDRTVTMNTDDNEYRFTIPKSDDLFRNFFADYNIKIYRYTSTSFLSDDVKVEWKNSENNDTDKTFNDALKSALDSFAKGLKNACDNQYYKSYVGE